MSGSCSSGEASDIAEVVFGTGLECGPLNPPLLSAPATKHTRAEILQDVREKAQELPLRQISPYVPGVPVGECTGERLWQELGATEFVPHYLLAKNRLEELDLIITPFPDLTKRRIDKLEVRFPNQKANTDWFLRRPRMLVDSIPASIRLAAQLGLPSMYALIFRTTSGVLDSVLRVPGVDEDGYEDEVEVGSAMLDAEKELRALGPALGSWPEVARIFVESEALYDAH